MNTRPITRPGAASCAAHFCAALLTAAQVSAQTPEPAAEHPSMPLSAPVGVPVDTQVKPQQPTPERDRRDSVASPDPSAADTEAITQITIPPVTSDPVPREAADTSEPPDRWLEADPSGDPDAAPKTNPETEAAAATILADPLSDPLAEARRRWRGAVAGEKTNLGFRAWIMAALGEDTTGPNAGSGPNDPSGGTEGSDPLNQGSSTPMANPPGHAVAASEPPSTLAPADSQASRTRDVSGRWLARAGPVALGAAGRVVTTFGAAIPTAFCAPLIVCYIELEPGEVLTDTPSWGDTVRWQVTIKFQGRDPETVVLEIKPSEDAGLTNLVIPTDRRLYTINLVNDPEIHTPILSFRYPDTAERVASERIAARKAQEAEAAASATAAQSAATAARRARLAVTGVETSAGLRAPGALDFRFSVTGTARFRPVRVYTDGRKTYIDLHPNYRGPLPTVVPGAGEENKALNTRVAEGGKRLVVDRVIRDIWLQAGSRRVRIRRSAP